MGRAGCSAGAVILPPDPAVVCLLDGVRDSKQMSAAQRQAWAEVIRSVVVDCGVGFASHTEMDAIGILPATRLAMSQAVAAMQTRPQHLL